MDRIRQLSKNLVNQIAAGEVIERPASVVKELVENSIDAGASRIEITVSNGCRNLRIADNGTGIHPDDIELAFTKHATSKLADEEGLFDIQTLGFRGEALASIISIAKVTCITRTKDFDYGIKAQAENSELKSEKTGCAAGTIFEVNDIFFNQPARLKFLKSEKTEFAYIQELIQGIALARPDIAFTLKNGASAVINTSPNADLLTRIAEIYSNDTVNQIKEVNRKDVFTGLNLTGYVSTPDYTRSSKKGVYIFVNSRIVKCPVISKAIDTAYRSMLPIGRYPFAVLNLEIPSSEIDINVHPQKREIRYKNANQIFNFVTSAVSGALSSIQIPSPPPGNIIEIPHPAPVQPSFNYKERFNPEQETEILSSTAPFTLPVQINKTDEISQTQNSLQRKIDIKFELPDNIKQVNVIGQFKNTYILVENEDNLEIIDQHIAQERYIYERLKSRKETASQLLIVSDVIDAEPSDIVMLENAKPQLEKFGYKIEKISDTKFVYKKIPQVLSKANLQDLTSELLQNLKNSPENDLDTLEEKIIITTACKASVKAGERLTLFQMEEIVKNLRSTKNPYTCPHGRPISHKIPLKETAGFFDRNI